MLDAFIIERIRNEREESRGARIPLRIEIPAPRPPEPEQRPAPQNADEERGVVTIDFTI